MVTWKFLRRSSYVPNRWRLPGIPKFIGDSYETLDREFVLVPTSEVPLVNLHREEIVDTADLPLRYTAFTPCFRREAGSAGRDTRGILRQHQFFKVELVAFAKPEESMNELRLTGNAEAILKGLGLLPGMLIDR